MALITSDCGAFHHRCITAFVFELAYRNHLDAPPLEELWQLVRTPVLLGAPSRSPLLPSFLLLSPVSSALLSPLSSPLSCLFSPFRSPIFSLFCHKTATPRGKGKAGFLALNQRLSWSLKHRLPFRQAELPPSFMLFVCDHPLRTQVLCAQVPPFHRPLCCLSTAFLTAFPLPL